MTLGDFLKRVDIERDKDKMLILSDHIGWINIDYISNDKDFIEIYPDTIGSLFSSDR